MRNVKKCVVVVICNLIQTGAEAGEEGASSWGALCFAVMMRFQTFNEEKPLMDFIRRSSVVRLKYSMASYISVKQRLSNFIWDRYKTMQIPDLSKTYTFT